MLTPKELESSRSFAGEASCGFALPESKSAEPSKTGISSRPAFCELNGDIAHLRSGDAYSSGAWQGSHQEQAQMSLLSLHTPENMGTSSMQQRVRGGSPQSTRNFQVTQPLSRTEQQHRHSQQQGPLSMTASALSTGMQLRSTEASTSRGGMAGVQEESSLGTDVKSGAGRASAAPLGRPATSHFVLQPSLTQSSGQTGSERNGHEQESRPTASYSGAAAPASQPRMVRELSTY